MIRHNSTQCPAAIRTLKRNMCQTQRCRVAMQKGRTSNHIRIRSSAHGSWFVQIRLICVTGNIIGHDTSLNTWSTQQSWGLHGNEPAKWSRFVHRTLCCRTPRTSPRGCWRSSSPGTTPWISQISLYVQYIHCIICFMLYYLYEMYMIYDISFMLYYVY